MVEIGQEIAALLDSEAAAALRNAEMLNGYTLTYAGWTGNGHTPAVLISAYARQLGESERKVMLKVSPTGRRNLEPRAHRDALSASPDGFRAAHLVEQPWDTIAFSDGGWIMFQEVANGRLDGIRPLSTILADPDRLDEAAHVCAVIVDSMLSEWTAAVVSKKPFPTVREYLSELLGERLHQDGTVRRWAEKAGVLSGDCPVGEPLNPFTLVLTESTASEQKFYLRIGNSHGDPHPGNILVPADPIGYRLVDLSRFAPKRALAFDPAYLLLTITAQFLPELSSPERAAVGRLLVDPSADAGDGEAPGLRAVLMAIIATTRKWAHRTGTGEEWSRELLLTTIGCALIMTGRDMLADRDRHWFYHLATMATARYLDLPAPQTAHPSARAAQARPGHPPEPAPENANPIATVVLPAGTALWRVHPRSEAVDEFGATPAGRPSALYVSRQQVTALLAELLRDVPFDDDGFRVLPVACLAGKRLSMLRTTRELVLVRADGQPDLVGLWLSKSTHGIEWPSKLDVSESSLLLVADRCPRGAVSHDEHQAIDLDAADSLGWLRESLRPYRVRIGE